MRVLVTGGRGFVGTHAVEALRAAGHEVAAPGRADGELSEAGVAERLLREHAPDVVLNLAGAVGSPDAAVTLRDNTLAAVRVAGACAAAGSRLVHGSTTSVYGGRTLYALSKRWSEEAVLLSCPRARIARLAYPYGPGGSAVTAMLREALDGRPVVVHQGSVRSWCWVGDAARALVLLAESGRPGDVDVGRADDPRSMLDVARVVCRLAGADESLIREVEPPGGPTTAEPLRTEALERLGWRPEVDFEDGLRRTLAWLRARSSQPRASERPSRP